MQKHKKLVTSFLKKRVMFFNLYLNAQVET